MNDKEAIRLLNDTFNNEFDLRKFTNFLNELFNGFYPQDKFIHPHKEYEQHIRSIKKVGNFKQKDKSMEILVIKLRKGTSLDKARSMQRNVVAKLLRNFNIDSALVAFISEDSIDWRFSFIKMDYKLAEDGKVSEELTPARRYSFLVGPNEPNHTCRKQFLELVKNEKQKPSIEEIESAFSIERVTKEFFERYKNLYFKLKENLDKLVEKDKNLREEFEDKEISTVDFSKKLLGQIVFLYFLQKKGWLGIKRDKERKFEQWGQGPKNFIKELFEKAKQEKKNFFNDFLEPLFYEALAEDRRANDNYYSRFDCKIPFLNGGLFEPINDYSWGETDINLDNSIFEEILGTFNEFNFTIKEDEPLEKEVAIDPEMLGKVFENLLEVKDRKNKGAFYTPREIVHYMCQQSLINYLETNIKLPRKDIEFFIQKGDLALEYLRRFEFGKPVNKSAVLPENIIGNARELDNLLVEIKICDPAVGSGAFPVGMMNEIIKARTILSYILKKSKSDYELKRETIENSLYGVDIEPSAVEITKLRFWLSLIVDEEDINNINPLPNLENKIMCGNSLLEEFEGIKLFDERLLGTVEEDKSHKIKKIENDIANLYQELGKIHTGKQKDQNGRNKEIQKEIKKLQKQRNELAHGKKQTDRNMTLEEASEQKIKESQKKLKEHRELQQKFFNEQNRILKKKYAQQIDEIEWDLIEETLKEQGNVEAIKKLQGYKRSRSKPFFLWKLYFADVFQRENPGFDVVIANPPYVRVQNMSHDEIDTYKRLYYSAHKRLDMSILFIELSFRLVNHNGFATFITSSQFTKTEYGRKIRELMKMPIVSMIYFGDNQLFESATNYTSVFSFVNHNNFDYFTFSNAERFNPKENLAIYILGNSDKILKNNLTDDAWELENTGNIKVLNKMKNISKIVLNDIANIEYGLVTGSDKILVFRKGKNKNLENQPYVFPLLRPSETDKYHLSKTNFFVIYPYKNHNNKTILVKEDVLKRESPEVYAYLRQNKSILEKRQDSRRDLTEEGSCWYGLMRHSSFEKVVREKILTQALCKENEFCLDKEGLFFTGGSIYSIYSINDNINNLAILGLLNSRLAEFYYQIVCPIRQNGYKFYAGTFLKTLPICEKIEKKEIQKPFIYLVDQILSITKDDDYLDNPDKQTKVKRLEKEIDQLVYKLYELTSEEIKIVEEFNKEK